MKLSLLYPPTLLLILLIANGCAPRYPVATPYHRASAPGQREQDTMAPAAQARPVKINPLVEKIRARATALLNSGRPDAAAQAIERGLRIAPKNGYLWSQLAEIRLKQGHERQARLLAEKSNSLAHGDMVLRQTNKQIIKQTTRLHNHNQ